MYTRTLPIDRILYKRKAIDEGVILGSRPWKWTLGNKYSPCSARRTADNFPVSSCSPHKANFQIYISKAHLEKDLVFRVVNHEYKKKRIESVYQVEEIGLNYVTVKVLEEKEIKPEPIKIQPVEAKNTTGQFIDNPFLSARSQQEELAKLSEEDWQKRFDEFTAACFQQPIKDGESLPAKVSPPVNEDVHKDTLRTPSNRIMIQDTFVKGKNQMGFSFLMENRGKQQETLFEVKPVEVKPVEVKPKEKGFSREEIAIIDAIRKGAEHIDNIIRASQLPAGMAAGVLLMLELNGHITQKHGRLFALAT